MQVGIEFEEDLDSMTVDSIGSERIRLRCVIGDGVMYELQ